MRTIAVSINKGGVGKTTVTKSIATAAAASGLVVLILDMDTQQNSTDWRRRRNQRENAPELPVVQFVTENDLPEVLARARAGQCDLVVIDTPPGRSSEAPAAVEAADLVLSPFWLDSDSFAGLKRSSDLARRMGTPIYGVLNHATPNSPSHVESARQVLESMGIPMCPVFLTRYEVYRTVNPLGLTVQEQEPNSRAAAEVAELWKWIGAELQLCTTAQETKESAA
jgi:chromosome partitioning protein